MVGSDGTRHVTPMPAEKTRDRPMSHLNSIQSNLSHNFKILVRFGGCTGFIGHWSVALSGSWVPTCSGFEKLAGGILNLCK